MAAGVVALWFVIDKRAQEHAGSSVEHTVHMNTLLIRHDAENRLLALDRLASRSLTDREPSQADWEADARRYLSDMPGFLTLQWLDTDFGTRWRVAHADNEADADDLGSVPEVRAAIAKARENGSQVFSEVYSSGDGNPYVVVVVPVFHHAEIEGVIAGVLEPGQWLEAVIGGVQSSDHHLEVLLETHAVYHYDVPGDTLDPKKTKASQFQTRGLDWAIQVTPATWFLSAGHADSSTLVLIVGLLLSGLTTAAFYFGFAARDRSHEFHDIALQLATLFRNLPGMAYRRNQAPDMSMAFVSEGCQALSGFSRQMFAEGEKDWLDLVHPDDKERVTANIQSALSAGEAFEIEYRITDTDGKVRWMWERGRAVKSEVDHQMHLEGFVTDITEQRAAESEAREHREHLAHADRLNMMGEMATGIAHEINQPLSAISILVQAGDHLIRTERYERLAEILEKLVRHAHRASAVIDRMQQMAKRHESVKETIDCDELIRDVTRLAEAEARVRDIEIEIDAQARLPVVSVDAVQIQQVLLNLLRNGMEAMQSIACRKGNTIGIRTRLSDDGGVEIAVIDRGSGVPEDVAEMLFSPFATTKESGMGMGLSISRAIVTAHGGNLNFRNNSDGGATFFFTLPPAEQGDAP
ncbi:MAG TPA: ATP-binding protein [Woeseiaceae bacterium]|nr:ATP-binding protein [Woeseiaceae bacterium]